MTETLKIIVASTNPIKIEAAKIGFERMFPNLLLETEGISVKSGVADQTMTSAETRNGARNRATNAKKARPDANYWIGLEGGVEKDDPMFSYNHHRLRSVVWCAILNSNKNVFGEGQPGSYALPEAICKLILEKGMELGEADDGEGSVGILTNGVLNIGPYYAQAVVLALIPFANQGLFLS